MAGPPSASPAGTGIAVPCDGLRAIAGGDHLRSAEAADRVAGIQPQMVLEPGNETELATALRWADAAALTVVPRGGGTKLAWGNRPVRANLILSTARLNRVIEHAWADLTVSVEAGCTIQSLQNALSQHGQQIAMDPLWPDRATVGGILSTNDTGTLRIRYGALRDLIIGVTIALADGTLASSGGKVVKNVAGYDLPKLITGSLGTLGVITRAVFRLHPLPRKVQSFTFVARDLDDANRVATHDAQIATANAAAQVDTPRLSRGRSSNNGSAIRLARVVLKGLCRSSAHAELRSPRAGEDVVSNRIKSRSPLHDVSVARSGRRCWNGMNRSLSGLSMGSSM